MPRGDGTGPAGPGKGAGYNRQPGTGRGRMRGPVNAGPDGYCECSSCGIRVKHNRAEPCSAIKCPQCGSTMVRV